MVWQCVWNGRSTKQFEVLKEPKSLIPLTKNSRDAVKLGKNQDGVAVCVCGMEDRSQFDVLIRAEKYNPFTKNHLHGYYAHDWNGDQAAGGVIRNFQPFGTLNWLEKTEKIYNNHKYKP